jgi:hypothetical protein
MRRLVARLFRGHAWFNKDSLVFFQLQTTICIEFEHATCMSYLNETPAHKQTHINIQRTQVYARTSSAKAAPLLLLRHVSSRQHPPAPPTSDPPVALPSVCTFSAPVGRFLRKMSHSSAMAIKYCAACGYAAGWGWQQSSCGKGTRKTSQLNRPLLPSMALPASLPETRVQRLGQSGSCVQYACFGQGVREDERLI